MRAAKRATVLRVAHSLMVMNTECVLVNCDCSVQLACAAETRRWKSHFCPPLASVKGLICDFCPVVVSLEQQRETKTNSLFASRMHVTVGAAIDHSQHRTAAN